MKFGFVAKHRRIWPAEWLCEALGVSRGGYYAWLTRPRSQRSRSDEELSAKVRASFLASDRTYGARRVWHDLLAEGVSCGLHRIERLMRLQALKARPRRRRLPPDLGERQVAAVAPNVLDRSFEAPAPNRKWIADFAYVWTAEGWLYVAGPKAQRCGLPGFCRKYSAMCDLIIAESAHSASSNSPETSAASAGFNPSIGDKRASSLQRSCRCLISASVHRPVM